MTVKIICWDYRNWKWIAQWGSSWLKLQRFRVWYPFRQFKYLLTCSDLGEIYWIPIIEFKNRPRTPSLSPQYSYDTPPPLWKVVLDPRMFGSFLLFLLQCFDKIFTLSWFDNHLLMVRNKSIKISTWHSDCRSCVWLYGQWLSASGYDLFSLYSY